MEFEGEPLADQDRDIADSNKFAETHNTLSVVRPACGEDDDGVMLADQLAMCSRGVCNAMQRTAPHPHAESRRQRCGAAACVEDMLRMQASLLLQRYHNAIAPGLIKWRSRPAHCQRCTHLLPRLPVEPLGHGNPQTRPPAGRGVWRCGEPVFYFE